MTKGPHGSMISHLPVIENGCLTFIADLRSFPSTEALTSGVAKLGDGTFLCLVKINLVSQKNVPTFECS